MNEDIEYNVTCSLCSIQEELPKLQVLAALLRDRRRGLRVEGCEGLAAQLEETCRVLEECNDELRWVSEHLDPDAPAPGDGERLLAFPGGRR